MSRVVIRSFSWGVINASRRASAPVTRRATGTPLGAAVDGSTLTHQPHAHMIVPGGGYRAPSIPRRLKPIGPQASGTDAPDHGARRVVFCFPGPSLFGRFKSLLDRFYSLFDRLENLAARLLRLQ